MDAYIYVLAKDGTPLMPTKRHQHVQKLLKRGKAYVVEHVPFVIRLKYVGPKNVQPLFGGTDLGRTNIGNAVVTADGTVVYKGHVTTRNREIAKLMKEQKGFRQASRRGERLARKRLAKRLGTTMKGVLERKLPGYGEGTVQIKDIINTEARFNNRKRPAGWITPSARQLIQTHMNMIRRIRKFLPVDTWMLEINRFAFMQLDDGSVYGADFQNGKLRGYRDAKDYVWHMQDGKMKRVAVAKNRKPRFEQKGQSLADAGLSRQEISRLEMKKSIRYYNGPGRLMPGAEFFYNGERYIMTGQLSGGAYLRAAGQSKTNFRRADCRIVRKNRGLVYVC